MADNTVTPKPLTTAERLAVTKQVYKDLELIDKIFILGCGLSGTILGIFFLGPKAIPLIAIALFRWHILHKHAIEAAELAKGKALMEQVERTEITDFDPQKTLEKTSTLDSKSYENDAKLALHDKQTENLGDILDS